MYFIEVVDKFNSNIIYWGRRNCMFMIILDSLFKLFLILGMMMMCVGVCGFMFLKVRILFKII